MFQIGSSTVSWSSRKQATVAKPSTGTEYVALSSATQEAAWLCRLKEDLGRQMDAPTTNYEDNQLETLSWQRMPKTITKLNALIFVIILFLKELFPTKSR